MVYVSCPSVPRTGQTKKISVYVSMLSHSSQCPNSIHGRDRQVCMLTYWFLFQSPDGGTHGQDREQYKCVCSCWYIPFPFHGPMVHMDGTDNSTSMYVHVGTSHFRSGVPMVHMDGREYKCVCSCCQFHSSVPMVHMDTTDNSNKCIC